VETLVLGLIALLAVIGTPVSIHIALSRSKEATAALLERLPVIGGQTEQIVKKQIELKERELGLQEQRLEIDSKIRALQVTGNLRSVRESVESG
jgi:hypothetical protein